MNLRTAANACKAKAIYFSPERFFKTSVSYSS
jgi:hypothetical protein